MQGTDAVFEHSAKTARVFFALWPDQHLSTALLEEARRMQRICGGRTMRHETLHLTLLFLGEVPRQRIPGLLEAAGQVRGRPFTLRLEGFSCWRHSRIGYATPATPAAALEALAAALRQHVAEAGIAFDHRVFSPHLTLLRNITRPVERLPILPLEWDVQEFVLVESVADAAGRVYRVLGTWLLRP